jgi:hypothetical protein
VAHLSQDQLKLDDPPSDFGIGLAQEDFLASAVLTTG